MSPLIGSCCIRPTRPGPRVSRADPEPAGGITPALKRIFVYMNVLTNLLAIYMPFMFLDHRGMTQRMYRLSTSVICNSPEYMGITAF